MALKRVTFFKRSQKIDQRLGLCPLTSIASSGSAPKLPPMRFRSKLGLKPEICLTYCDKIETVVAKGHIVRVPDEVLQEQNKNSSKPRNYIPRFNVLS